MIDLSYVGAHHAPEYWQPLPPACKADQHGQRQGCFPVLLVAVAVHDCNNFVLLSRFFLY